jgi:hypothetical protein
MRVTQAFDALQAEAEEGIDVGGLREWLWVDRGFRKAAWMCETGGVEARGGMKKGGRVCDGNVGTACLLVCAGE